MMLDLFDRRFPNADFRLKGRHQGRPAPIGNRKSAIGNRQALRRAIESLESRTLFATYNIVDIGPLGDPDMAINATGQIAVTTDPAQDGVRRANRFAGGTLTDIGTFGGPEALANGINASGNVVGSASDAGSPTSSFFAFLWDGSTKRNLGTLGGSFSNAYAINDSGVVVGSSQTGGSNAPEHAFLWNGSMSDLRTLGDVSSNNSSARAINNNGQIAGQTAIAGTDEFHAFRRTGSAM